MNFAEAVKIALQSLWASKLRSALTLLGMMIGVASVITVMTLVSGANKFVATKISGYGADVFTVSKAPSVTFSAEEYLRYNKRKELKFEDYLAVATECKSCVSTGSMLTSTGRVVYGKQSSTDTRIQGLTWTMPPIQNLNVVQGRSFTSSEEEHNARVAVIGYDIVDNLLGTGDDPLGKQIRVDGDEYTVIGVGERQGKTLGQSQDNWVSIPITNYMRTHGTNNNSTIIYVKSGEAGAVMDRVSDEVRSIIRTRRHDAPGAPDSFALETNDTFVGLWKSISSNFAFVAVAIAAISLVVGGIVIMNIMLVSVTERTREIGVRKALGARRRDVLLQFLIESATMSVVGGAIGVMGGVLVAKLITVAVGWPSTIGLLPVVLSLFVAGAVGIFFGVYPARKAAMLDPIVALRSEL